MNELVLDRPAAGPDLRSRDLGSLLRRLLLWVWRLPFLHPIFRLIVTFVPGFVRRRVDHERARAREQELAIRIRTRPHLVPERELRRLLDRGLRALAARHGRASLGDYLEFGVYN